MSNPFYSLNVAAERTIVDYITGSVTGSASPVQVNYYRGQNNLIKSAPCVIVEARQGEELYLYTNVYRMNVKVFVKEMAMDTSNDNIGQLAGYVFNCFYDPNRNNNFSNTGYGFSTMGVFPGNMETDTEEDALISVQDYEFICCLVPQS